MHVARPFRIQRRRSAGWRMPVGAVYCGRPGRWGNPFVPGAECTVSVAGADGLWYEMSCPMTLSQCVEMYRANLEAKLENTQDPDRSPDVIAYDNEFLAALGSLRGRDLACWCPLDQPCHVDVLLEVANR